MSHKLNTFEINRNFGTVEDVEYTGGEGSFEEPRYIQILKHVKTGLGLDISQRSTGVVIWKDNKLEFAIIDLGQEDNETDFRELFKESLIEVIEGNHFDVIGVEGVYGGENFSVVRKLMSLNPVIDELISEKYITCNILNREDNQTWKRILRQIKKIKGSPTPKVEIRKIMEYLEFPIESLSRYNTEGKKDRDQDLLDALGVLLSTIIQNFIYTEIKKDKQKLNIKDMKIWHCGSFDEYEACYNDGEEYTYFDVDKNLRLELVDKIKETNAEVTLVTEISTNLLGRFGLEHNLPFEEEYICIIATPKSTRKPRKKKKAVIIR